MKGNLRSRFLFVLSAALGFVMLASTLFIYISLSEQEKETETELIAPLLAASGSTPEVRQRVAVYRAFDDKRKVRLTRSIALLVLAEVAALGAVMTFFILGFTRPLNQLAKEIRGLDLSHPRPLAVHGRESAEVAALGTAFNSLAMRLSEYHELIGGTARYRGWKEISRIIVHEVNNLVSPIRTYGEYLMEKYPDEAKIPVILQKIEEIGLVLSRFRDMAHLPEAQPRYSDLRPLLNGVCADYPECTLELPGQLPHINADQTLLAELFRNLLKNAREAGPGTLVRISAQSQNGMLALTFCDNGPGIDPSAAARLFTPGFTTKKSGSGIGLVLSRQIAREHGGDLVYQENPGGGARFVLTLPVLPAKAE